MAKKVGLIATDMDGTFLDAAGSFDHQRLRQLLQEFKRQNILFTIASGRSLLALDDLFQDFIDQIAVIAENGGLIQYKNRILFKQLITRKQYLKFVDDILANPYNQGTELLLSGKKAAYILAGSPEDYIAFMKQYYKNIQIVEDFEHLEDDIFKITTNFPPQDLDKGMAWLNENVPQIQAVTTGFKSIDVILKGVNKGLGLEQLCQTLAIPSDQVLAFGDNLNDLEMMTFAGFSVAPDNARAEIKEIADDIIPHHQEKSVMTYMEGMVQ